MAARRDGVLSAERMSEGVDAVPAGGLPHDPWLRVHVRAGGVIDPADR